MFYLRRFLLWLCLPLVLSAPLPAQAEPVRIFAAASLKGALDQVIAERGLDAVPVYGGSAAIARQVAQGAGADIVLLAHADWMDWLAQQDLIKPNTRCDLLGNRLVLAGPSDAPDVLPRSAEDVVGALGGGRLAVGQLLSVPAGQYAAAYLNGQGWLDTLRPHLAQTQNVRLALALVARGEAPLGFVYASDVFAEPRVRSVFEPPLGSYPPIHYPMAATKDAAPETKPVFDALADAGAIFVAHGFTVPNGGHEKACP